MNYSEENEIRKLEKEIQRLVSLLTEKGEEIN